MTRGVGWGVFVTVVRGGLLFCKVDGCVTVCACSLREFPVVLKLSIPLKWSIANPETMVPSNSFVGEKIMDFLIWFLVSFKNLFSNHQYTSSLIFTDSVMWTFTKTTML